MTHTVFSRQRTRPPHGQAQIELVLFLPLLMALLATTFTVASLFITCGETAVVARHQAFQGRHQPWRPNATYQLQRLSVPGAQEAAKILGPRPVLPPDGSLLKSQATHRVPYVFAPFRTVVGDAAAEQFVLGGSWDFQEIPFETRAAHPPLRLTEKANYFGGGVLRNLQAFAALAAFGSAADAGNGQAPLDKGRTQARAAQRATQVRLNTARQEQEVTQQQLDRERQSLEPDKDQLQKLEGTLRELQQEIHKLQRAEQQLDGKFSAADRHQTGCHTIRVQLTI